jgi:uncharacterized protein (DUF488 family)
LTESFVSTIGFTKTTAEGFFERLLRSKVRTVIDVRLNNTSQLAGFAKAKDLKYLLGKIGDIKYQHLPILAPTDDILTAFKKEKGDWSLYESRFLRLMAEREIENKLKPEMLDQACLLCSEDTPHHCHRRLVCEYLNEKWGNVLRVNHL